MDYGLKYPYMPELKAKKPSESVVHMTELVLPQHTNALRGIFGGVVMSWIDIAAAIAAARHSMRTCVTASIDELHFLKPIKEGYVVNIDARLTSVHRTSCEVQVLVGAENPQTAEKFRTARAYLTFVALDDIGVPTPMPPLDTRDAEDNRLQIEAVLRRETRKILKAKI